ncbi:VOC family protein [Acidisphaera rubrifaciens]|uniref:Lactoylglutathione lyase n=1 Tax=Acidisphaera rubrifaciens HS-AP3 TaxID=1231350 RepID=A0A0D6P6E9_9PROT|nr:VOC family protein [Acidisphaera rubrifaciens]GAN76773.1 lactoylglutathione lyase [Acidisphaera rubrifaciens HS-AP3]
MRFTVDRLDHLVINCRDVDISAAWYQRVLGMDREEFGSELRTALKFGGQKLNLRPHDHDTRSWIAAATCAPGTQDLCFVTAVPTEDIIEHLQACKVVVELGPIAREGALGAMMSVYCRDPDGNLIEIATYGSE